MHCVVNFVCSLAKQTYRETCSRPNVYYNGIRCKY